MAERLRKGKCKAYAERSHSQTVSKGARAPVARRKVSQQKVGSSESDESHSDDRQGCRGLVAETWKSKQAATSTWLRSRIFGFGFWRQLGGSRLQPSYVYFHPGIASPS